MPRLFVKPLIDGSTTILWHGVDQGVIDAAVNDSADAARHVSDGARHMQSGQFALLRRMGRRRRRGRYRVHGLDGGDEVNLDTLSPFILSLVTFIPGWRRIANSADPAPRARHQAVCAGHFDSRIYCFAALARTHASRSRVLQIRNRFRLDHHSQYSLPHGHRRHLGVAGRADNVSHAALRADFVDFDSRAGKGIFYPAADSGDGADRRLHLARPVPLLFLLGSDPDTDGAADRHVRARPQGLRRGEVFPLHHDRLDVHAGGDSMALREDRQL